jgi:predicted RNA-binding Zn-ribbon protein involved in translation (DUF1610 family)
MKMAGQDENTINLMEHPICTSCKRELTEYTMSDTVGRTASCPHCSTDLHSCLQCQHYDEGAYNACREPQAERVVDKDRSNFCDYFTFARKHENGNSTRKNEKDDALKKLDDLFS